MVHIFGFVNAWISQGEALLIMCSFAVAEGKLKKPTVAEVRSDFLCSDSRKRSEWYCVLSPHAVYVS